MMAIMVLMVVVETNIINGSNDNDNEGGIGGGDKRCMLYIFENNKSKNYLL